MVQEAEERKRKKEEIERNLREVEKGKDAGKQRPRLEDSSSIWPADVLFGRHRAFFKKVNSLPTFKMASVLIYISGFSWKYEMNG